MLRVGEKLLTGTDYLGSARFEPDPNAIPAQGFMLVNTGGEISGRVVIIRISESGLGLSDQILRSHASSIIS